MKNKIAIVIAALLVVSTFVAGCGRTLPVPYDGLKPRPVPHAVAFPFTDCIACHVADQLAAKIKIDHKDFTNDQCAQDGCHGALTLPPNPTPSAIARPIPHAITAPLDNCVACHDPATTGTLIKHSLYKDNALCLTPACHKTAAGTTTPPVTTTPPATTAPATTAPVTTTKPTGTTTAPVTTQPAGTTTTPAGTTTPPATTAAGGKQLPATANPIANVNHNTAAKVNALKGLCLMMCHGPGTPNQVPLPPTWDGTKNGSTANPGVWTVVAGSPQDHTGRTDDQCTQAGCHAMPAS
jgi:hypothetical protein